MTKLLHHLETTQMTTLLWMENEFLSKCWGALGEGWESGCLDSCALTWFSRPSWGLLILSISKADIKFFGYIFAVVAVLGGSQ
jgi:hypothetical protein